MRSSNERPSDQGLCVNCDDRIVCKLHQPGQQILFCEEYQLSSSEDNRKLNRQHAFTAPIDFGIKL